MNRKQFLSTLLATLLGAGTGLMSSAVNAQASASTYTTLEKRVSTEAPAGKIEVVEFFWFGCPHCYSLEPVIEPWIKKLPDDVVFRREHVPFFGQQHQQLFYTLQALGRTDDATLNTVFEAIQRQRKQMKNVDEMVEVLSAAGIDGDKFRSTFNSFGVRTAMQRSNRLVSAYGLDGVPVLAINGQHLTSPSMAGSNQQALTVANDLIQRERKALAK
ncbi:MAG: thiol:disulfide interchange protein DsbA/DsbL [Lautropia sp.]|nr:thiol:disulfide interchange protein DsbA/DsbL [Lautropia sp.]